MGDVKQAETVDEIYAEADIITLHVPQTPETEYIINKDSISR
jgi:phosphoglycerate dehydrogenase-like enzyme